MRVLSVALVVAAGTFADTAKADPYRWCAELTINRGGASNCYFHTLEQCRATVSGIGGFCRLNTFYDGLPITTPPTQGAPRRKRT